MSQIGTLVTGAGVVTTLNLQFVPQFILVGTLDTDLPLSAVSWNVAGDELVNIATATHVVAFSKLAQNGLLGADVKVSQVLQVADGYYGNQQFQVRFTNAGATTPAIYGFSQRKGAGELVRASQNVILDGANQRYSGFVALQFLPTNVTRADIEFFDIESNEVFSDSLTPAELADLFAMDNITDANGLTATLVTVSNYNAEFTGIVIKSITIYASGANVTVNVIGSN